MAYGIELNPEFRRALELLEGTDHHVLVTGRAGTGKSTLLQYFVANTCKNVAVLAPTGVAAVNVGGQTIHSFFGFKPNITPQEVAELAPSARSKRVYRELELLVVDEVSMVRADLLDCMDRFLRVARQAPNRPFGGVRMAFFGDLYQLPPVVTRREKAAIDALYATPYFYSSQVFQEINIRLVELEKVYRQTDVRFLELLGAIRSGAVTEADLALLNSRCLPEFEPGPADLYVQLTATNALAEETNQRQLARLRGRLYTFIGELYGDFGEDHAPAPTRLELKVGAQVMLVNNDSRGRWVNGTLGRVVRVVSGRQNEGVVVVELQDGDLVEVGPHTWELFEYYVEAGQLRSRVVGRYIQLPLMLAWAVTIHKSQGKTFDRVIIDIGRGAFAPGQVYVALSRCRTLEGIVLKRPIQKKHIWVDYRIADFLTRLHYRQADEALPPDRRRALIEEAIRTGSALEVVYLKPGGEKSRRVILPKELGEFEYGGRRFLGLRAYCTARRDERLFRVDRILELRPAARNP
jgi:hypothetical protein